MHKQNFGGAKSLIVPLFLFIPVIAISKENSNQFIAEDSAKARTFAIDLEWRPRTELRNGYAQMANDTSSAAFFTTQRTRLNFNFLEAGKYQFVFSIQDIRLFGRDDPRTTSGTLQVFEAYLEPFITKKFSIRIGRQRLMYDNQRLFAQNDWRQNANAHDGINFRWVDNRLKTELAAAWNQTTDGTAGTHFAPIDAAGKPITNYKLLVVNYLQYKISKSVSVLTINCADGFEDAKHYEKLLLRFTNGGRIEYERNNFYATISGYYQHGHNTANRKIAAYYFQPELRYVLKAKTTFRLGMEYMSGQDATNKADTIDRSFVPLYGVAHRFMGFMDLYTRFPSDLNNAGLINPYLFITRNLSKKTSLGFYFHQFYSQNKFVDKNNIVISNNLGFEHDILFNYKPNNYTSLEVGACYYLPTASTTLIKKAAANANRTFQYWSYVMITFKPQLLKAIF